MAPLDECHLKGNLSHLFYKNSSSYPTKSKASKNCTDQGLRFWEDFTEMKNNKISLDDLLNLYIKNGTINASDVMSSSKEDIMKTIISKIHPYKITKRKAKSLQEYRRRAFWVSISFLWHFKCQTWRSKNFWRNIFRMGRLQKWIYRS